MGISVVVIPDEEEHIQEPVEEEDVIMTGFSWVVSGETVFSSFWPTIL